jgi:prepilin-type N-terminal cleavage/methylation domain-containing protein
VKKFLARKNESGFTLIEVLVTLAVFAVIAVIATSVIVSLNNTAARFGTTSTTQNDLTTAAAQINRDISSASNFVRAEDKLLEVKTNFGDRTENTIIFAYVPGSPVPSGVQQANLPNYPAIVRQVTSSTGTTPTSRVLVPGFDATAQANPLFAYFDGRNVKISTPVEGDTKLKSISRVQFFISAKIDDRALPVELASSATPRTIGTETNNAGSTPQIPAAPFLTGKLTPSATTADLSWTIPEGATSYTLYRINNDTTKVVSIIPNPATNTFSDTGLTKGEKYTYYVVASGPGGISPQSNKVNLTVVPDKAIIVNINSTKQLADVKSGSTSESGTSNPLASAKYTVARNLTNQITWKPVFGAEGYYVYQNGSTTPMASVGPNTTTATTTAAYGAVRTYTVIAWNSGDNGSGGNGLASDSVQLISPPTAPGITARTTNSTLTDNQITISTRPANSDGFNIYGASNNSGAVNCSTVTKRTSINNASPYTYTDGSVAWGSSSCYAASGYNDAGEGPRGAADIENKKAGPFSATSFDEVSLRYAVDGYFGFASAGNNSSGILNWSASQNVGKYVVKKSEPQLPSPNDGRLDGITTTETGATAAGYGVLTPGSGYVADIFSCAPWYTGSSVADGVTTGNNDLDNAESGCRMVRTTFMTSPDVPIETHSLIQTRQPSPWVRRATNVYAWTRNGSVTSVQAKAWFDVQGEPGWSNFGAAVGASANAYSGETTGGQNTSGRSRSYLSLAGYGTKYSDTVSWTGVVATAPGCTTACGQSFANVAETAPTYYAGHHAYYVAR